jgi:uncharacterized protein
VSPRSVPCPTCRRPVEWSPESAWRPFCSERCKLVDLGAWFTEQRAIAGDETSIVPDEDDGHTPPQH